MSGTPEQRIANRPGLPAVAYRVGTHATFVRRMLQRLATATVPLASDPSQAQEPPLARLTTRTTDDPAIALIDAWATVGDVLTFYQERTANEGFLRTATERGSVLELARAIGYELNPGVAANALLAFVVEDAVGAPGTAFLDAGLKVLSIPGQNERPQTFETIEPLEARAAWNALRPRTAEPQVVTAGATQLYLRGIANQIEPGDVLAMIGPRRIKDPDSSDWDVRIVRSVEVVPPRPDLGREGYTRVAWDEPLSGSRGASDAVVFRQRAGLFGHNAPDFRAMPDEIKAAFDPDAAARLAAGQKLDPKRTQWPDFTLGGTRNAEVDLDALYPRVLSNGWLVLMQPGTTRLYHVDQVDPASRTDYTLSARVTRLTVDTTSDLAAFGLRETLALVQSERLILANRPTTTPMAGGVIALDRRVDGLRAGQRLIVTGRLAGESSDLVIASEAVTIDSIVEDPEGTRVNLAAPLQNSYDPHSVSINANVARATHGESVRNEVLGSGNGGVPNQRFALRKPPLTYVSAATSSGAQSTLSVRVDGVEWRQTASLFGLSPGDQSFTVRVEDDGQSQVIFGDGRMGARLPSGAENVTATYRSGIGLAGNVRAESLSLLQVRPLGIRGVSNPLPAAGAASPENLEDARANAPLTVLTLDRIVSLRDFEDFARAFAGIGKAQAARIWNGQAHIAHLTVAGADGGPVDPVAALPNLETAIESIRDPENQVLIQSYTPWSFGVAAELLVDPRYAASAVLAEAATAVGEAFSFDQRGFGQPVSTAEVIAVLQQAPGVQAVNLTRLFFLRPVAVAPDVPLPQAPAGSPPPFLPAAMARWDGTDARPAELLLVDPQSIVLTLMQVPT